MILNLKNQINLRAVLFEDLAKILIRQKTSNNFIFMTRRFDDIDEIIIKYRFDVNNMELKLIKFLNNNLHRIDLVEFVLDNVESRIVKNLIFYEVKTKTYRNISKYDVCRSSSETYKYLISMGFNVLLISFILFEDWRYSFNIHKLKLGKLRIYSRYNP